MASYANIVLCLSAVGAGLSSAAQQILNANLKADLGSPWWAGLVSFATGTLVMGCAGVQSIESLVGRPDLFGRRLRMTEVAVADELAAAALTNGVVINLQEFRRAYDWRCDTMFAALSHTKKAPGTLVGTPL